MIEPLRSRHRKMWTVAAALLPPLVALAIVLRPKPPRERTLPVLDEARLALVAVPIEDRR